MVSGVTSAKGIPMGLKLFDKFIFLSAPKQNLAEYHQLRSTFLEIALFKMK